MSAFDKIIGYEQIKDELRRIADVLKNRETYGTFGVSMPKGLLLHGEPGVGKTLMAQCLIEETGYTVFTCRKNVPDGEFVNVIRETFEKAAEAEPAIVYLDDMDKFANDDEKHRDSEEFVTVQACIDEVKDRQVFVLATANDTGCLPRSLTRPGRFDHVIEVETPEDEESALIIEHYLNGKKLALDVDVAAIASLLSGKSCATLEMVINEAGLRAGYERADFITTEHIVEACLNTIFDAGDKPYGDESIDIAGSSEASQVAWHEAGHVAIREIFMPGSTTIASARRNHGSMAGFVRHHNDKSEKENLCGLRLEKLRIITDLGGRAATEIRFGTLDVGSESDLRRAYRRAYDLYDDLALGGFSLLGGPCFRSSDGMDETIHNATAILLEELYHTAKQALSVNRDFLDKLASALAEKDYLLASDIAEIRESCDIVKVAF